MIVIEKNEGKKIPYETDGCEITFDDDLSLKLNKRQKDEPVHIDVCHDRNGDLVIGAAAGRAYVAEIDIPAREYIIPDGDEGETTQALPLDMDKVTLTLWAVA